MRKVNKKGIFFMLKLILFMLTVYLGNGQTSVAPVYQAAGHSRSGTWIAFTTLKTSTDTIPSYTVMFSSPLSVNFKLKAIASVSSFDLLSSTQFSFNTSILALSYNGFVVQLQIIGNTYVNLIKFNYLGMSWNTGPSAQLLYYDCFLTSDLAYISTIKNQSFYKQQLVSTVVDGTTFNVQSFITGMNFFNNKDSTKKISVVSYISNNTNYITQQVYITGNTILQWMCIGTVVLDNNISPWGQKDIAYRIGSFILDRLSASIDMTTFPTGYLPIYNEADRMFFGLSEIELALGKPYQIVEFKSENNLAVNVGYMSLAAGGKMGYLLYAHRLCNDPTKQLYSFVDSLCWDTCPNGQVKSTAGNICVACHFTCQTCTGPLSTQCSACDGGTNHRTLDSISHTCICQPWYVENNVSICPFCSAFIPNCATCTSKTVCTNCISSIFVFNSTSITCQCATNTYFIPANNICAIFPGCLKAQLLTGAVYCQTCDKAGHFQLDTNAYTCKCVENYTLSSAKCIDRCGDGINPQGNSTTYCDDGNLVDGDGCSATCAVEANFGCFIPPGKTVSYCSPVKSFSLKYLWTERMPNQNAAQSVFQVSPASQQLSPSNFTYYVESTIPNTIATGTYDASTSLLRIKIDYLQTIEDQNNTIKVTLDPYKMTVPSQSFTVKTTGVNFDLTFDSDPKFNMYLWYIVSSVSGLIVLVSIVIVALNYKIAAVELLLSSQVVYLGVLSSIHDNVSLYPLTGTKYLCGYNTLQSFQINKSNYQTSSLLSSATFAEYLLNFNITPAILVLIIFIILPLKINVWFKTYQRSKFNSAEMQQKLIHQEPTTSLKQMSTNIKKAQLIADTFVDRVYFAISLVAYFPLVVYFAFQLAFIGRVGQYQLSSFANIILSILLLLVDFSFFILIFQDGDKKAKMFNFGSKKLKSYPNRLMMSYFFLVCAFAVVLLSDYSIYVLIGINVLVGIYIWVENPFDRFSLQHIDSLLKPIISLICLVGIKALGFFTTQIFAIPTVIISLLFVSMLFTIIRTIMVKLKREQNAKKILEEAQMDDQIDIDEKQMKNSTDDSQFNSQRNKKITAKFENNLLDSKKSKKGGKDISILSTNNLPPIMENEEVVKKENQQNDSGGQLNKDNEQQSYDPDELGEEDEDQLTRIKRSLRQDLKKRRGVVNKANDQVTGVIKKKTKSSKKSKKLTFEEDQVLKQHHI